MQRIPPGTLISPSPKAQVAQAAGLSMMMAPPGPSCSQHGDTALGRSTTACAPLPWQLQAAVVWAFGTPMLTEGNLRSLQGGGRVREMLNHDWNGELCSPRLVCSQKHELPSQSTTAGV